MTALAKLYETDYAHWANTNIQLLKAKRFEELDIEHLIEELGDMSRSERNELENRLIILLAHLLKWQFQYHQLSQNLTGFEGKSWRNTIIEQRFRIARRLRKVPSLKSCLEETIAEAYVDAVELARQETGLSIDVFPQTCPYSVTQIQDEKFYPNANATKTQED